MEEQCAGLKAALQPDWRGGVCCRVLRGGAVAIGDSVSLAEST
jgi:MOSC domain-containing protein YiiM